MSEIVAKCSNAQCGAMFTVPNAFLASGGGTISFSGVRTNCPKCGSLADIFEGTFQDDGMGSVKLKSGPPSTIEAVSLLRKIIADAKAGKDAERIVQELEENSPKLGSVARNIIARRGITFLVIALSWILTACEAKLDMKLDWNVIADQLHVYATGKDPYPGLTGEKRSQTEAGSEKGAKEQQSEPEQTSSLKPQPSHHKSRQSKRQKRRNAQLCVPKRK